MRSHSCRLLLLFICWAGFSTAAAAQTTAATDPSSGEPGISATLDDGPYVTYGNDELIARWVCDGKPIKQRYPATQWPVTIPARCGYPRDLRIRAPASADDRLPISGVDTVVAVSDIHGQYELLLRLLQANQVVDAQGNWKMGKAHLVINGDVFDRGPKVTEAFWLLYALQQQAADAGGGVHFLIGNHETMTLYDDLRYLNDKYWRVAQLLGTSYPALYGQDTVLGQWLHSAPQQGQVNDMLFLHGGISPQYLQLGLSRQQNNDRYRASLGLPRYRVKSDPLYAPLYDGKTSPIWYRGYFHPGELSQADVDAIARQSGVEHIVVGHTSMNHIGSYFNGRVIAVDSSIKHGINGELLFVEHGRMSRGLLDGSRAVLEDRELPDSDSHDD
ncbi:metallophosphoesterase [Pseudoxanthomonas dokdonensis]|uniref:Calcineurin-like phosphoesterase domain-containing protein n=1 Tax=Pseudoxanthomonas dokdonensis TaxID=344882 RepID=A0A0R0CPW6_9GAMM|nr:metallophosphoesterase [Pseudoxanthomonas dokdonensis]KRG71504.1 hypothetical protein ABB29_01640 [Pseudoxanthomonas dokdonensis]